MRRKLAIFVVLMAFYFFGMFIGRETAHAGTYTSVKATASAQQLRCNANPYYFWSFGVTSGYTSSDYWDVYDSRSGWLLPTPVSVQGSGIPLADGGRQLATFTSTTAPHTVTFINIFYVTNGNPTTGSPVDATTSLQLPIDFTLCPTPPPQPPTPTPAPTPPPPSPTPTPTPTVPPSVAPPPTPTHPAPPVPPRPSPSPIVALPVASPSPSPSPSPPATVVAPTPFSIPPSTSPPSPPAPAWLVWFTLATSALSLFFVVWILYFVRRLFQIGKEKTA